MPIYTTGEDNLTLKVSHRMKEILNKTKFMTEHEKVGIFESRPSEKDEKTFLLTDSEMNFLVNSAARWETFSDFVKDKKDSLIEVMAYRDGTFDLGEALDELVTETNSLSVANFSEDFKIYKIQLQTNFTFGQTESDISDVLSNLSHNIRIVKNLEEDFQKKGFNVKVIGYIQFVEKEGINLEIKSDSNVDDLTKIYLDSKRKIVENRIQRETELLENIKLRQEK